MKPVILFRPDLASEEEFLIAKNYFNVLENRTAIMNSLVIARYSALPFYKELEEDLKINNSFLINSYKEHLWIANFDWYNELKEFTFPTWFHAVDLKESDAPFIVKGRTNSRKHDWNTLMFAESKARAIDIMYQLNKDPLISNQGIVFRKYEKLETFEIGINGLPFTNEWRFFLYKENILSYGYYWSIANNIDVKIDDEAIELVKEIAKKASKFANFYVLDVAKKEDGSWILIEVNDGQMTGLSENDPNELYSNLLKCI